MTSRPRQPEGVLQAGLALVTRFALLFAVLAGGIYFWDTYHGFPWLYVLFGAFALYLVYLEMKMAALPGALQKASPPNGRD